MYLKNIKLNMIAKTEPTYEHNSEKLLEEYNYYSGLIARNCITTKSFDEMILEDKQKTFARAENCKESGHHSVFDHEYLTFEIKDASKAFAMVINNEKVYNTTEKSMRYTVNYDNMTSNEKVLYEKWQKIFDDLINEKYKEKYSQRFTDLRVKKLAQENARYLLSVYAPTSLIYTASVRQFNYLYNYLSKEIENENTNDFYAQLKPNFKSFNNELDRYGLIDEKLMEDNKNRKLSLYNDYKATEYFGDVYSVNYDASLAYLAQAQRHRTLNYNFSVQDDAEFYIPPILKNDANLVKEWLEDCAKAKEFTTSDIYNNLPQSTMVNISEMGTLDNFILKMKERKCTNAQLEINNVTNDILNRYQKELEKSKHPRAEELKGYQKGARCTFKDYKCTSKCGFVEGINETREI